MKECCKNCRLYKKLELHDHSDLKNNGVIHKKYDGFACLIFAASDDVVIHMVGVDDEEDICECYSPRKE